MKTIKPTFSSSLSLPLSYAQHFPMLWKKVFLISWTQPNNVRANPCLIAGENIWFVLL